MPYISRNNDGEIISINVASQFEGQEYLGDDHPDMKALALREFKADKCRGLEGAAQAKVLAELTAALTAPGKQAINTAKDEASVEEEFTLAIDTLG